MYVPGPAAVGAKLVSLDPPTQAAAGLGGIDVLDLPVGDLSVCGNLATGESCRGLELGGIIAHCTCVNLSQAAPVLELKQMLTDVTGLPTDAATTWTAKDETALLAWADDAAGLHLPDVQRWWASGWVSVDDLLQRTQDGRPYPTGAGVLALADAAGCLADGDAGLEPGPGCERFPSIGSALERYFDVVLPDPEEGLAVYPPAFGEPTSPPVEVVPGGNPLELPLARDVRLPQRPEARLQWLGWSLAGAATAAAAWALARRIRA